MEDNSTQISITPFGSSPPRPTNHTNPCPSSHHLGGPSIIVRRHIQLSALWLWGLIPTFSCMSNKQVWINVLIGRKIYLQVCVSTKKKGSLEPISIPVFFCAVRLPCNLNASSSGILSATCSPPKRWASYESGRAGTTLGGNQRYPSPSEDS